MKLFMKGLLVFCFGVFYSVNVWAGENPSVDVPLVVIANQAVEALGVVSDSKLSVAVNEEAPLQVEITPVLVNKEKLPDEHVVVETVAALPKKISAEAANSPFNRMKQLTGRWEGSGENVPGEKKDKIVVLYEVTAGGNAVLERIFPNTPQEMVTMYYEEKGQLMFIHFCLIGTRSLMMLKPFAADNNVRQNNVYEFGLVASPGLDPAIDTHMHSLKITFLDENHMNQEWEMFEAGKSSGNYSFVLARVLEKQ